MTEEMNQEASAESEASDYIELLACPFCGGAELQHADCGVWCMNTECEGGVDFGHFFGSNEEESRKCKEAVAKAWNRRAC